MPLNAIIAAVKAKMESVADIGIVHDRVRLALSESVFRELFKDPNNERILGWTITRESGSESDISVHGTSDQHLLVLRGWMGIDDATETETTFQQRIEDVRTAFRQDRTINGSAIYSDPVQVRLVTQGLLGSYLCHYCELTLRVEEKHVF